MGKKDTDKEELELELEPEQQDAPAAEEDAPAESPAAEEEKPDELEQLKKENADLSDRLLRQLAEFDNFRKRTAREKDEIGVVAKSKCILELLPVLDNFERAMTAECADAEFKKGMELIYKGLWDAMAALGVEEIAEAGVPFDPNIHNAVMYIEDEKLAKNVVAQVLQKGYRIGGKVLRYAMVQAAN